MPNIDQSMPLSQEELARAKFRHREIKRQSDKQRMSKHGKSLFTSLKEIGKKAKKE